jgi:hypothetical protein
MIPVSVGQGILKSQRAIAKYDIDMERRQHMRCYHRISEKSWFARFILGIKF